MNFETIILKKEDHVATITLNRPQAMNAITMQMFKELIEALQDVNGDDNIRLLVLTGAGRAFCASLDMKEGKAEVGKRLLPHMSIEEARQLARHFPQKVTLGIRNMEKPTIAMVNGLAIGDGFDWVLACDLRIGSEKARFMNAFVRMALFPNTGGTWFFPRIMGLGKALELLYTGDWLEAEEAYRIGVLNKLVPSAELEKVTMELAHKIAKGAPAAIKLIKLQTYKGLEMSLETALELAADGEVICLSTQDHIEAVAAFLEKREPVFTGK